MVYYFIWQKWMVREKRNEKKKKKKTVKMPGEMWSIKMSQNSSKKKKKNQLIFRYSQAKQMISLFPVSFTTL